MTIIVFNDKFARDRQPQEEKIQLRTILICNDDKMPSITMAKNTVVRTIGSRIVSIGPSSIGYSVKWSL